MANELEKKYLNQGGRPSLANDEMLSHRLVTRVRSEDYQAIEKEYKSWKSGRAGRIADFLREIILRRNVRWQQVSVGSEREQIIEITQTLHGIRQHLRHIDTNYNQVAKRINSIEHTRKLYYEVQNSKIIIEKLAPLIEQIDAAIKAQTESLFSQ
ncbi:hypothetical protein [Spirosoma luteum]|uniref:hypothetical protein n=1 Tax=Spirosoma luteum TaxID=431553 RepID=UPI00036385EF|nr:hypothetical protein [Spirosoma luteum]